MYLFHNTRHWTEQKTNTNIKADIRSSIASKKWMKATSREVNRIELSSRSVSGHWTRVGLMLGQRRRRWPNIKPARGDVTSLPGHACLATARSANGERNRSERREAYSTRRGCWHKVAGRVGPPCTGINCCHHTLLIRSDVPLFGDPDVYGYRLLIRCGLDMVSPR